MKFEGISSAYSHLMSINDVDSLLQRKLINDVLFNKVFFDVQIYFTDADAIPYLYRRLWEKMYIKNDRDSNIHGNSLRIPITLSEAIAYVRSAVPAAPALQKRMDEFLESTENIRIVIKDLLGDPIAGTTNMSIFQNVCMVKKFEHKPTYNARRILTIKEAMQKAHVRVGDGIVCDWIVANSKTNTTVNDVLTGSNAPPGLVFGIEIDKRDIGKVIEYFNDIDVIDIITSATKVTLMCFYQVPVEKTAIWLTHLIRDIYGPLIK